jgi:hypothetical protein
MESSVVDYVPDIQRVQDGMARHQEFNCQLQHLTSNVRALEQQLTQHMCISTSLTTQLAMQRQQAMLTRQQTTTPSMVNANIPPAYGNLNQPFNNYMGYPNSLQQNFPFHPAHVGYPAHSQQQNSPYQTGPSAFNQQQNFPYVLSRVILVLTVSCVPCIRGIMILF